MNRSTKTSVILNTHKNDATIKHSVICNAYAVFPIHGTSTRRGALRGDANELEEAPGHVSLR